MSQQVLTKQILDRVQGDKAPLQWRLQDLDPTPEEVWDHLRSFLDINQEDIAAMLQTVESLLQHGYEIVVENYAYLEAFPETAALLGWEGGADPKHLAERRRFFTVWLARTIGLDFSYDFARYLFRAGQIHAGHGKHHLHIPATYVLGSIGLMTAAFSRILEQARIEEGVQLRALAAWNKVLLLHLQMMLQGYQSALAVEEGEIWIPVKVYGRLRTLVGRESLDIKVFAGQSVLGLLRKFFNYYPHARSEALTMVWEGYQKEDARGNPWMRVRPVYLPKSGWRVLRNGRDIAYLDWDKWCLEEGDWVAIFPPGR